LVVNNRLIGDLLNAAGDVPDERMCDKFTDVLTIVCILGGDAHHGYAITNAIHDGMEVVRRA